MLKIISFLILLSASIHCWEALPQIPTGRRSQYLVLHENGGYKYGYDTGDGSAAEQSANPANQVEGRYLYDGPSGQKINLKYTAGVQGFVPEGVPTISAAIPIAPPVSVLTRYSQPQQNTDDEAGTGDASYSFTIDTDTYKRQETSDARGNIKGSFSYNNAAGAHDLSYIAGDNTGFVAESGSLATPNGLGLLGSPQPSLSRGYSYNSPASRNSVNSLPSPAYNILNTDGSYSFGYSTADATQQQSGDANGNVKGCFSYSNPAGTHDLSYVAGSETGFAVTGGSLSQPNGFGSQTAYAAPNSPALFGSHNFDVSPTSSVSPLDGSYRFEYFTDDSSRKESADAKGNVQGSYSYRNQAGNHDLSYIAGSSTGFQVTGGSLSTPNDLGTNTPNTLTPIVYNTPQVTAPLSTYSAPEDSSYSFTIDTDEYKRIETSDANGNVQGSYSYRNNAGSHDLSFISGSATGFQPTGGSLSKPNTISSYPSLTTRSSLILPSTVSSNDDEQNTGDASYNFSIDTDEYKRTESSDASGNVIGSFAYKNSNGQHALSYEAGARTGFRTTGGSLSIPPGLTETQVKSEGYSPQPSYASTGTLANSYSSTVNPVVPDSKSIYRIGNVIVNSYLPPGNEKRKFGYIFDTKY